MRLSRTTETGSRGGELEPPPGGSYLLLAGARMRYIDRGSGPVVVLIHGFPSSIESSYGRLMPLLEPHCRVVAMDLAGLGYSPAAGSTNMGVQAQAERVIALLDHLGVASATVVGSSFGGAVAQFVAVLAPPRVERLVLLAAVDAGIRAERRTLVAGYVLYALLLSARGPWIGTRLRVWANTPDGGLTEDWGRKEALEATRWVSRRGLGRAARNVIAHSRGGEPAAIEWIRCPTLVVSGSLDTTIPANVQRNIAARITGAEYKVIANCGHSIALSRPAEVGDLILARLGVAT